MAITLGNTLNCLTLYLIQACLFHHNLQTYSPSAMQIFFSFNISDKEKADPWFKVIDKLVLTNVLIDSLDSENQVKIVCNIAFIINFKNSVHVLSSSSRTTVI